MATLRELVPVVLLHISEELARILHWFASGPILTQKFLFKILSRFEALATDRTAFQLLDGLDRFKSLLDLFDVKLLPFDCAFTQFVIFTQMLFQFFDQIFVYAVNFPKLFAQLKSSTSARNQLCPIQWFRPPVIFYSVIHLCNGESSLLLINLSKQIGYFNSQLLLQLAWTGSNPFKIVVVFTKLGLCICMKLDYLVKDGLMGFLWSHVKMINHLVEFAH